MYKVKFHGISDPSKDAEAPVNYNAINHLRNEYNGDSYIWNNYYEIVAPDSTKYDFVVIYNLPQPNYDYDQKKAILIYTEPNMVIKGWSRMLYGDDTYDVDSINDADFFRVFDIKRNKVFPMYGVKPITNYSRSGNRLSVLITEKNCFIGHKKRLWFINNYVYRYNKCDRIFSKDRTEQYNQVKSKGIFKNMVIADYFDVFSKYKYNFNCENCWDDNYVTEKLVSPLRAGCMVFYAGTPTVFNHIDPRCYIYLDLDKPDESYETIVKSIYDREWEKRLPYIQKNKSTLSDYCNVLKHVELIIRDII